jgi:hypothetical protein
MGLIEGALDHDIDGVIPNDSALVSWTRVYRCLGSLARIANLQPFCFQMVLHHWCSTPPSPSLSISFRSEPTSTTSESSPAPYPLPMFLLKRLVGIRTPRFNFRRAVPILDLPIILPKRLDATGTCPPVFVAPTRPEVFGRRREPVFVGRGLREILTAIEAMERLRSPTIGIQRAAASSRQTSLVFLSET